MMTRNHGAPGALRQAAPHVRTAHQWGFALGRAPLLVLMDLGAIAVVVQAVRMAPSPLRLDAPLIAHITGLLAGYGVAVMLVLMFRVPALEHGVGADTLARWHTAGGRAILTLIAPCCRGDPGLGALARSTRTGRAARVAGAAGTGNGDCWHPALLWRRGRIRAGGQTHALV